jgi:hypothetical protein
MKRRTEITIESRKLTLIRRVGGVKRTWCPSCNKEVEMLSADEAVILFRLSSRKIHRMVDEGKLHFTETPDGLLLICMNSFSR